MRLLFSFVALIASFLLACAASAATLIVNGSGILTGATGVNVGGTLYEVEFVDGTCVDQFTGCDEFSDLTFTFETWPVALAAAQALGAQVLLDTGLGAFDSNPALTFGCANAINEACLIYTPFDVIVDDPNGSFVSTWYFSNSQELAFPDGVAGASFPPTLALTTGVDVFARWTPEPVPEPATLTLLGLGLAGMGARRWRQKKPTARTRRWP